MSEWLSGLMGMMTMNAKPFAQNHLTSLLKRLGLVAMTAALMASAGQASALNQVTVEKDQSLRVALKGSAGNVIVTNPRIADVTMIDSRTLYIIGRGVGSSGITVTDAYGRSIWEASVLVTTTSANAVTLYRGTQPVVNVCVNTCVEVTQRPDGR